MTSESFRISAASSAYVKGVCASWGWSWQEMSQENDDGLDGLAYVRTKSVKGSSPQDRRSWKHEFTGGLIHVQIKSGKSYLYKVDHDKLVLNIHATDEQRQLWARSPLPCALVYVESKDQGKRLQKAWWVDLKSQDSYTSEGHVIVPRKNRFEEGVECRRPFSRLANGQHRALSLQDVSIGFPDSAAIKQSMKHDLKWVAWNFYSKWKSVGCISPVLGTVIINRTGWSHITRTTRPVARILASFSLLPAASRIIEEVTSWRVLRRSGQVKEFSNGTWAVLDFIGISANVIWPARAPSEVMVILRRQTIYTAKLDNLDPPSLERPIEVVSQKLWFYTVYEPGRGKRNI